MNRSISIVILLAGFLTCSLSYAISTSYEFDPGLYVLWNHLVVVGELVSHGHVAPRRWGNDYKRYTIEGAIVVLNVVRQARGLSVAPGDTLHFSYPYGQPISEEEEVTVWTEHAGKALEVDVGARGLFTLKRNVYGYIPGIWFSTGSEHQQEIETFLEKFSANPDSTVAGIREKYPTVRLRLEYP